MQRHGGIPVLVTGPGNLALGALRVFGRGGIRAFAACSDPGLEVASRWYEPVPGNWSAGSLEQNLRTCPLESGVILPTSERGAIEAARLPPGLKARFPSSTPAPELLEVFADKERQMQLLEQHGVPFPKTWSIESPEDARAFNALPLSSVFLKPRDSGRFSATYGRKSIRATTMDELVSTLVRLQTEGFKMVLQEYIPGPATSCYLIDGFIDRHGEVRGLFARRRLRQHPSDFGNSSAVYSVSLDEVGGARAVLVSFLKAIGYRGIFNAEFKRDPNDDSFRFFEVNPRTWLYAEFAARCGFDALTMAYLDALEEEVPECASYEEGRLVIYPHHDIGACLELRRQGALTVRQAIESWIGADQLVYVSDDPRPFFLATLRLWRDFLMRRLRRLRCLQPYRRDGDLRIG